MEYIVSKYNYWIYIVIMMVGLYAMMGKTNLLKKAIGLGIFQWAIILYFISIAAKKGATVPIIEHGHGEAVHAIHAVDYVNPLPHVLMLTAIVVAVSTTGVALALLIKIY
ncbi:MAG TPA: NADH-quinone oxidoreductase subunit J, partial [Syntrophaceae bacterium]|nr:NADH-quinone oxidoreductase subunit J [Syntrophaceae bacterium]